MSAKHAMPRTWQIAASLLLVVCALLATGCAAATIVVPILVDVTLGGIGIYQRYEDRQAQKNQTAEIRRLWEEVRRLRQTQEQRAEIVEPGAVFAED